MSHEIEVGDTVAYSDTFLDRQHLCPSHLRSACGVVKVLHRLDNGVMLADVEWNNRSLPKRVKTKSLAKTKAAAFGE